MDYQWSFDPCPCWEESRQKARQIGLFFQIQERYVIEAASSSDRPTFGRVICANCGSVRTGQVQSSDQSGIKAE